MLCIFFFFKQKTAYEVRISDWSSDVCSSDLHEIGSAGAAPRDCPIALVWLRLRLASRPDREDRTDDRDDDRLDDRDAAEQHQHLHRARSIGQARVEHRRQQRKIDRVGDEHRSEEHTSELQSLMRTSYAVFCLKKQKQKQRKNKE